MFHVFLIIVFVYVGYSEECDHIGCSYVEDEVCGMMIDEHRVLHIKKYQNECHMFKIGCLLNTEIELIPDVICKINKVPVLDVKSRRLTDFSIVGAAQACNHSCPIFCTDTYEPACAKIWKSPTSFSYRTMINHCHVDLFSCAAQTKVTIQPLSQCHKNAAALTFMKHAAALRSGKLIVESSTVKNVVTRYLSRRKK